MWPRAQHRILIVSDRGSAPSLTPHFLDGSKVRIVTCAREEKALKIAARKRPCLIIEEWNGHSGPRLELCRRLKAHPRTQTIPLILAAPTASRAEAENAGPDALIDRPVSRRCLFDAVRRFVPVPQRANLRHLVNLRFRYTLDDEVGQAFTRDLSLSGAFVKTDRALPPGTSVVVEFLIPGDLPAIRCQAVVRRSTPFDPQSSKLSGFAVEFNGLSDGEFARLERFITRLTTGAILHR